MAIGYCQIAVSLTIQGIGYQYVSGYQWIADLFASVGVPLRLAI
jgi:hypothetical protein